MWGTAVYRDVLQVSAVGGGFGSGTRGQRRGRRPLQSFIGMWTCCLLCLLFYNMECVYVVVVVGFFFNSRMRARVGMRARVSRG